MSLTEEGDQLAHRVQRKSPVLRVRALIFDVDGTLYDQGVLRRHMLLRLIRAYASAPLQGWNVARVLRRYRQAQELLRHREMCWSDVGAEQMRLACSRTGSESGFVSRTVRRWMEEEPLAFLAECVWAELPQVLRSAREVGIRIAAFSDYPAEAKLKAMGVAEFFELTLCAQSPGVQAFKPHPRGLLRVAELMRIAPQEAVYIGDRPEVDAICAARAGMRYVDVDRRAWRNPPAGESRVLHQLAALGLTFNGSGESAQ